MNRTTGLSMADRGEVLALQHSVLIAAFTPESLPEKVAAAGVVAAGPPDSRSSIDFRRWGAEPSKTAIAAAVAALARDAYLGTIGPEAVEQVESEYGRPGIVGTVGIGAAARMFDRVRAPGSSKQRTPVDRPLQNDDTRATLIRIRKAFDRVPPPWDLMAWEPRTLSRWWELHELVMAPGMLTGDEKRLAMIAVCDALNLSASSDTYRTQLAGWSADEIRGALTTGSLRLRRGVRAALVSIGAFATGALESERFELAAAALPAARAAEFRDIVDVAVGLAAFDPLS